MNCNKENNVPMTESKAKNAMFL